MWAFCQDCDRWFYCAGGKEAPKGSQTCPVCGSEPGTIVNRAAPSPEPAEPAEGAG